ncbi:MAG: alpha/beta hydrolase, partial [Coriobacteriia bacterium]|nr:alpha/beta hydrolase [Coriobacteriia bacterium]
YCPVIEPLGGWQPGSPVLLFLHGGGLIFEAMPFHWMAAAQIVRATGARLAFLNYPLLPEATIVDSTAVALQAFQELVAGTLDGVAHVPEDIVLLGDSAGATLVLTLASELRQRGLKARHLICVSPAQCYIDDPQLRAQVAAQDAKDDMLRSSLLETLLSIMVDQAESNEFYLRPLQADYRGFSPLTVFAGTEELFYPFMPGFLAALERDQATYDYFVGEGLCHVWPYVPAPDCRWGLEKIIQTIGEAFGLGSPGAPGRQRPAR